MQPYKLLIIGGICLIAAGLMWAYLGDKLQWLGKLPGDIRITRGNFRFYFPLTTMLLISLLINFILFIIKKML